MILCTQIASVSPSQHERPNEFIPERWLRQDKKGLETDMSSDGKYKTTTQKIEKNYICLHVITNSNHCNCKVSII